MGSRKLRLARLDLFTKLKDEESYERKLKMLQLQMLQIQQAYLRQGRRAIRCATQRLQAGRLHKAKRALAFRFEPGDRGWGWAAVFFDYENDGDDDMYLSNGWIEGSYAHNQKNQMFVNDGNFFYLFNPSSPEAIAGDSRAVVAFDMDNFHIFDAATEQAIR